MTTTAQTKPKFDLTSTNGIGTVVTFLILAAGAAFGIGEDMISAFIYAATPLVLAVREAFKGIRKPRWVGNIATYIISAVVLIAPWLNDVLELASPIADALIAGDFSAAWPMFIPLISSILLLFRTKPWQKTTSKATISTT